jgi:hypothetical protein
MPSSKQVRANAILSKILEQDKERPTIDPRSELEARMVGDPSGLWARITVGYRFDAAPAYGDRTERRAIRDAGWQAVTIYNRNMEVLAVNVRGSYFHIAFYKPGPWEGSFGVDWEGDHQIHAWGDPPIGDDLDEQRALREKNLQLEPTRGHPRKVDELRTSVMRPRRARQPQPRPDGPLTVALQRP